MHVKLGQCVWDGMEELQSLVKMSDRAASSGTVESRITRRGLEKTEQGQCSCSGNSSQSGSAVCSASRDGWEWRRYRPVPRDRRSADNYTPLGVSIKEMDRLPRPRNTTVAGTRNGWLGTIFQDLGLPRYWREVLKVDKEAWSGTGEPATSVRIGKIVIRAEKMHQRT